MADELIKVPDIGGAEGAEVVEVLVSLQISGASRA